MTEWPNHGWIAGVDEVGRGPLLGPVVAAAVILPVDHQIVGLKDSKKLSEKQRQRLAEAIRTAAVAWALGRAEAEEIDRINILQATLRAMQRAIEALPVRPDQVLVDGPIVPLLTMPARGIVHGDALEPVISAASILAKVARDAEMLEMATHYPAYGIDRHKGYPTPEHLQALQRWGVLPEHRRSFAPVARVVAAANLRPTQALNG